MVLRNMHIRMSEEEYDFIRALAVVGLLIPEM